MFNKTSQKLRNIASQRKEAWSWSNKLDNMTFDLYNIVVSGAYQYKSNLRPGDIEFSFKYENFILKS